jgi:hypothetical protein
MHDVAYLFGRMIMHMACGAQDAMYVSYWKVRQVLLIFVEPK